MRSVLRRLSLLFNRDRATRDLEDEMALHRQLRAESLERFGTADARQEANREAALEAAH